MADDVCIANIGRKGRQQRMRFGLVAGAVGLVLAGVFVATGISRWWRLVLFLPAMTAGIGIFQATAST
jgi:uncharacterized membrane protein